MPHSQANFGIGTLACYRSPEYQAAKKYLQQVGAVELVIVPGYDGPQPA